MTPLQRKALLSDADFKSIFSNISLLYAMHSGQIYIRCFVEHLNIVFNFDRLVGRFDDTIQQLESMFVDRRYISETSKTIVFVLVCLSNKFDRYFIINKMPFLKLHTEYVKVKNLPFFDF